MGEKIKDINKIKIGNSMFTVELNEGYSAKQGRVIHVQNRKFRYLLKEKDFFELASMAIRAWGEFEYSKKHYKNVFLRKISEKEIPSDPLDAEKYHDLSTILRNSLIDYRILEIVGSTITIIIPPTQLTLFVSYLKDNGFIKNRHPISDRSGCKFIYQLTPFRLFSKNDYLIEVFCQIPCASLTPNTWIPLHRMIQDRVWKEKIVKGRVKWCDNECSFIYLLCKTIFNNRTFTIDDVDRLKELWQVINKNETRMMLLEVFFNFTDDLMKMIDAGKYEDVIPAYFSYTNY